MEETISGTEDTKEEMDNLVKQNVKSESINQLINQTNKQANKKPKTKTNKWKENQEKLAQYIQ